MFLFQKRISLDQSNDLFAQISAQEKQLMNVEESKKLLEHLEQKRRKQKLQSNILDITCLEAISKKISALQMKKEAGIPCSIAVINSLSLSLYYTHKLPFLVLIYEDEF